jgi:hypothetical protein
MTARELKDYLNALPEEDLTLDVYILDWDSPDPGYLTHCSSKIQIALATASLPERIAIS